MNRGRNSRELKNNLKNGVTEFMFFSSAHATLTNINHIMDHKESHDGIQTEINCKEDNKKIHNCLKN